MGDARTSGNAARAAAIASKIQSTHEGCEIKYTFCENPGCFEACLLKCYVKDGNVVAIDVGDEAQHSLWVNVLDAARYGIADGDNVHVVNRKGEALMRASCAASPGKRGCSLKR